MSEFNSLHISRRGAISIAPLSVDDKQLIPAGRKLLVYGVPNASRSVHGINTLIYMLQHSTSGLEPKGSNSGYVVGAMRGKPTDIRTNHLSGYFVASETQHCQRCKDGTQAVADAATRVGSWGYFCVDCLATVSTHKLGPGYGQILIPTNLWREINAYSK